MTVQRPEKHSEIQNRVHMYGDDQGRTCVGTTCKVEETTRGSPGGETGEKEKDGNMQEERRKAGEKARQKGDQQEATTAADSIGMLAFGGVGHRRIMARAFSR